MWSALEGSILLWVLVLSGYLVHVARKFKARMTDPLVGWALLVMFLVSTFFFLLVLGPANPFASVDVPAGYDGPGPNPLLQEHLLLAFHPPMRSVERRVGPRGVSMLRSRCSSYH